MHEKWSITDMSYHSQKILHIIFIHLNKSIRLIFSFFIKTDQNVDDYGYSSFVQMPVHGNRIAVKTQFHNQIFIYQKFQQRSLVALVAIMNRLEYKLTLSLSLFFPKSKIENHYSQWIFGFRHYFYFLCDFFHSIFSFHSHLFWEEITYVTDLLLHGTITEHTN